MSALFPRWPETQRRKSAHATGGVDLAPAQARMAV